MAKTSIPKGTRDFSPEEMAKRNYIFDTIRGVYALYGFLQIETPAMETLQTLLGKYGEEGDKLLFKILNSGDYLSKIDDEQLLQRDSLHLASKLCEKGLRYDLTVPFARYVVQHREEIQLPFRRFQIQPVWRADRPQKGRYREFYQCDADVVGSNSLLNEVELIQIMDTVFTKFGIRVAIKINNRKILTGIAEVIGEAEKIVDITVAIDKLDKIGLDGVNAELRSNGISDEAVEKLQPIIAMTGTNEEKLQVIAYLLASSETGMKGVEETRFILEKAAKCGISFGADRIYDVLCGLDLYPERTTCGTQVLFINFGEAEADYCLPMLGKCREEGIRAEIYPDSAKMKKQMAYANSKNIPFVVLAGESEIADNKFTLKNMTTGEQKLVTADELVEAVK